MRRKTKRNPFAPVLSGLLAALGIAALASVAAAQPAMPQGAQRFKVVEIIDRNGFEAPIPAARVMVPMHWQAQGGVVWNPQAGCQPEATRFEWAAGEPGGVNAVEMIPATAWQTSNLPAQYQTSGGCTNAAFSDIRQYLNALVQVRRPGAVVLDYRPRPEVTAKLQAMLSQHPVPGVETRMWADAGELLIGYRYKSQNVREIIGASGIFTHSRMVGAMGDVMEYLYGSALPAFAMRAPDGALDFKLYKTISKSVTLDEAWQTRMNRHNTTITQMNTKGAADRARISREANAEISKMINEGWKSRQEVMDKSHDKVIRAIRGEELYNDPEMGERVELPNTYNHAWRLQDGSYLMTDNPNLNPNVEFGINGTELQRAQ